MEQFEYGKWYPIESAPKDESIPILLTDGVKVEQGRYHHDITSHEEEVSRKGSLITYAIIKNDNSFWCGDGDLYLPTHWMPLPQPPTNDRE